MAITEADIKWLHLYLTQASGTHDHFLDPQGDDFALAVTRALYDIDINTESLVLKTMKIEADICVYTNGNVTLERR